MSENSNHDELTELATRISKAEKLSDTSHGGLGRKSSVQVKAMARMMRIGADFLATVLGALGLGWFVDVQMETTPWCMLSFLLIGVVTAFGTLIKAVCDKKNDDNCAQTGEIGDHDK